MLQKYQTLLIELINDGTQTSNLFLENFLGQVIFSR